MEDPPSEAAERREGRVKEDRRKKRKRENVEIEGVEEKSSEKRLKKEKKERKERKKKEKKERKEKEERKAKKERKGNEKSEKKEKKEKKKRRKSDIEVEEEAVAENDAGAKVQIEDEEEKETEQPTPPIEEPSQPKKKEKKKKRKSEVGPESAEASEPVPLPKHFAILEKLRKVKEKVSSASTSTTIAADTTAKDAEAGTNDEGEVQLPAPAGLEPIPQPPLTKATKPHVPLSSALPQWLANPIAVGPSKTQPFSEITCISQKLHSRLSALSMANAFPVQSAVIPLLLSPDSGDICISAATGSGKTLAYVLPIVQALSTRVVTRLRAVIVVPTRELVSQVHSVACSLSTGTSLKIGTAVGSKALSLEQAQLVVGEGGSGGSKIDVLVCTPGRLVEHIKTTKGFTLKFLKWLVIDEADRLLAQSFQEWASTLIGEIERVDASAQEEKFNSVLEDLGIRRKPPGSRVRKVVLSATMTRDAGKLSDLKLRKPSMIAAIIFTSSNSTAARLSTLLSTFSSHPAAPPPAASWITKCITSETPWKRRARYIRAFTKGEAGILVCSDLVARGLDIENVAVVINYEVPASVRGYVHRVGRTARAGRKGVAVSLVGEKEAGWFRAKVGGKGVVRSGGAIEKRRLEVPAEGVGWRGVYEEVLFG
ncbi:P-loop containing nucleoside triphosphate hydrolase protein [Tuber brumale]|nr:P-loop containing nucleoside triphosphate hydrolase protein [Tuber brumale]